MQGPDLQAKIDRLATGGPLKAWSVIVTVLGDLLRAREERISARVLNRLIGAMGISPQAMRVAIHRLKRDGWVEAERQGRESLYRLSPTGWAETKLVWSRVYDRDPPKPRSALLVVGPPDLPPSEFAAQLGKDAVPVAPRVAIVPGDAAPAGMLWTRLTPEGVPGWAAEALAGARLRGEYATLAARIAEIEVTPEADDPVGTVALRLMILHQWRRLCLRHGALADALLPPDWEGARARAAVIGALDALALPGLPILEDALRETDQAGSTAAE